MRYRSTRTSIRSSELAKGPASTRQGSPQQHISGPATPGASSLMRAAPMVTLGAPVQRQSAGVVADDALEREADIVADRTISGPAAPPIALRADGPGVLQRQPEDEEEEIQAKAATPGAGPVPVTSSPPTRNGGRPLPAAARAFFEPRFGHDFSDVRVHSDSSAAMAAREINAHAFTHGRHIVFGAGQYAPDTPAGQRLLAHELTHIVQQRGPGAAAIQRDGPETAEAEAEETPTAATDPHANELLDALTAAERQQLMVMMTRENVEISAAQLNSMFSNEVATTTIPLPEDVTVRFSSSVSSSLQRGLRNVAGLLIQQGGMVVNRIVTVPLNLTSYGGDHAAYRFTFVERSPSEEGGSPTRELLIERLGTVGQEGLSDTAQAAAEAQFQRHGFSRGSGWSDAEYAILLEAVALVPDSLLSQVSGITFQRAGTHPEDPQTAGEYDEDDHSITLFDTAFESVSNRTGIPGESFARESVRAIAHEIGHAIEKKPLRDAWNRFQQAQQALRDEFGQYENPPGSGSFSGFPAADQTRFNTLIEEINQAERNIGRTSSVAGYKMQEDDTGTYQTVENPQGADTNEFRQAAAQDGGVRISTYADDEWQEYFAEAFSLYVTDPGTLERLRPHVYRFFTTNFPR